MKIFHLNFRKLVSQLDKLRIMKKKNIKKREMKNKEKFITEAKNKSSQREKERKRNKEYCFIFLLEFVQLSTVHLHACSWRMNDSLNCYG